MNRFDFSMLIGQDRLALKSMGDIGARELAVADHQQAVSACLWILMVRNVGNSPVLLVNI